MTTSVAAVCTYTAHQVSGVVTVSGDATGATAAGVAAAVATGEAAAEAEAEAAVPHRVAGALSMTDCPAAFGTRK